MVRLAVALATRAVEAGYPGYFSNVNDMVRPPVSAVDPSKVSGRGTD